jgi:cardiolipin synthase
MIHAKTAVADGVWSRVGSSNLNLASLLGNWELDVALIDRDFAEEMEQLFLADMHYAVEVVLRTAATSRFRFADRLPVQETSEATPEELAAARAARERAPRGSTLARIVGRMARASSVLGRALVGQRSVGREDVGWITAIAVLMLSVAVLGVFFPRLLAFPVAFFLFWLGLASLFRAWPHDAD